MSSTSQKTADGAQFLTFPVGPLQCNCSLLWDETTKEGILIDPGDNSARIQSEIDSRGLRISAIVHTHAHFDHIGASRKMHQSTRAPLHLHPSDKMLWDNIQMQGAAFGFNLEATIPWQKDLEDNARLKFGAYELEVLHTPGHTPGSCSFSCSNLVFAGDTLFKGSIGRTDLWGGDFATISQSIKERLYCLDQDTTVITGHGPSTMIGIEQRSNAFVRK